MKSEEVRKTNEVVLVQESKLLFQQFDHEIAFDLCNFLIEKAKKEKHTIAVAIRDLNGAILFQYLMEGTNLKNQHWMIRKFNTVIHTKRSSFGAWLDSKNTDLKPNPLVLEEKEYAFCGGGFPICLLSGELVAVMTVSNLPHELDHHFLVQSIAEWQQVEIPYLDFNYDYSL